MADGKLRIIDVAGTASERGFAQGQLLGDIIRTQIGLFLDGICRTHSLDSADAYLKVFVEETGYVATITEHALHLLEEVRGIADGAGLPFEHVLAYNLLDEEWEFSKQWKKRTSNGVPNGEPPGCTVAGFTSRDGGVYLSQTMDIPDFHDGSQVVVRHHLSDAGDGPSALLVFTAAGLIALFGCNSSGLAVAVNNLSTLPTSDSGLPVAFVIRSLLERTDISSAETFLKSVGHAIGQHYALASPEGLRSVEAGAGGSVYRDEGVSDILLHTNHPLTPGAKSCSIADDDPGFSRARLGVISSAAPNLKSEKDLMAALADRSAPVSRSRDPTVAGPQFLTFGSFVSCSRTGAAPRFWVAPGPPHLVDFKEVPWGPVPLENGNHLGPTDDLVSHGFRITHLHIPNLRDPVAVSLLESTPGHVLEGPAGSAGDRTGTMLWGAGSLALLAFLTSHACEEELGFVPRKTVELGCGTGLVTAGLGCLFREREEEAELIATDGNEEALENAKRTLDANRLANYFRTAVWDWSSGIALREIAPLAKAAIAAEIVYPSTTRASLADLFSQICAFLDGASMSFVLSYVQRKPETTLAMVEAAVEAGLSISAVPWERFVATRPAMDARILVLRRHEHGGNLEEVLQRTFPSLREELRRVEDTRRLIEAEAAEFVLPDLSDD